MPSLTIHITAEAPLTFPTRKPGTQFRQSLPYVPGAVIFGALGRSLADQGAFDNRVLRDLRCSNAYPTREGDRWVRPLPATALAPKGNEELIIDSLYERVCWEQQKPVALIYAPTDADGRPWEAVGGRFYTYSSKSGLRLREVNQRTLTRVSINRRRGTAEDQRLYSFFAISEAQEGEPTRFVGSLSYPDGRRAAVESALEAVTHLGGRLSTGLGSVTIRSETLVDDSAERIRQRIGAMTRQFQEQARLYATLGGEAWPIEEYSLFTVNLLADALLYEHGWLPTTEFSAAQLKERTGIQARLVRAFTTPGIAGGWQVTWQRPKPTEVSVAMGGLYLFQAAAPLTTTDCESLLALQRDGIGERCAEGYGQIRICDSFHVPATEEDR